MSLTTVTGVAAQSPAGGPSCAMVTVDEVNAIFLGAGLSYGDNSARYYCTFRGDFDISISVMTSVELDEVTPLYGEGEAVTVAGGPGWYQDSSGNLAVPANRSVVFMNGWGSPDTRANMSRLAALIIPRIPPGPDPAVVERLTALLPPVVVPETVGGAPGWYLIPADDVSTPEIEALQGLLASQGRTTADMVLVLGSDGADGSAILAHVPGLDPSALGLLLLNALLPAATTAPVSVVEIGGRQVTRIEIEQPFFSGTAQPMYAFVIGDAAVYATGSDAFVQSFLGPAE
ncbi:MAG: hypothetical protein KF809_15115 [Chloroflexi bacterium]|nr:hypothetical protein [Chloroflexota bacterium]